MVQQWKNRTNDFKSLVIKLDPNLLLNKKPKKVPDRDPNGTIIEPSPTTVISTKIKTQVLPNIKKLHQLLLDQENIYVHNLDNSERTDFINNVNNNLKSSSKYLSELETSLKIFYHKNGGHYMNSFPKNVEHYSAIFKMVRNYIKLVGSVWANIQKRHSNNRAMINKAKTLGDARKLAADQASIDLNSEQQQTSTPLNKSSSISRIANNNSVNSTPHHDQDDPYTHNSEDLQTNPYQSEQNQMLLEFNSMKTEVDQIGQTIHDIAKMQEELTEQVVFQGDTIENIDRNVENATENVQRGNEELRNAIYWLGWFWECILMVVATCVATFFFEFLE